jgi:hypothetical protein
VDDTDDPSLGDQRNTEQASDPLLAEYRVVDLAAIEVVDDDGLHLRGDPTREPNSDRDPDALADLFLDPGRGGGDELTGRAIAQQDGSGIDLEELSNLCQQLVQQVRHVQVDKGDVGDRLDATQPLRGGSAGTAFHGCHLARLPVHPRSQTSRALRRLCR